LLILFSKTCFVSVNRVQVLYSFVRCGLTTMIYENGTVYLNDVELTYVVQKTMNAVSKIPCTEVDAYFLNTSRKIMYNVA